MSKLSLVARRSRRRSFRAMAGRLLLALSALAYLASAGTGEIREPEMVETPRAKRVAPTPTVPPLGAAPEAEPSQQLEEVVILGRDRSVLGAEKRHERDDKVLRGMGDVKPDKRALDIPAAALVYAPPRGASAQWRGEGSFLYSDLASLRASANLAFTGRLSPRGFSASHELYQSFEADYERQDLQGGSETGPRYLEEERALNAAIWTRKGRGVRQRLSHRRRETRLLDGSGDTLGYGCYAGEFSLLWPGGAPLSCGVSSLYRRGSDDGAISYHGTLRDSLLFGGESELAWYLGGRADAIRSLGAEQAQAVWRTGLRLERWAMSEWQLVVHGGIACAASGVSFGDWQTSEVRGEGGVSLTSRLGEAYILSADLSHRLSLPDHAGLVLVRRPVLLSPDLVPERAMIAELALQWQNDEDRSGQITASCRLTEHKIGYFGGTVKGTPLTPRNTGDNLLWRVEVEATLMRHRLFEPQLSGFIQGEAEGDYSLTNYLPLYGAKILVSGRQSDFRYTIDLDLVHERGYGIAPYPYGRPTVIRILPSYALMNLLLDYTRFRVIKPALIIYNINDSRGEYSHGYLLPSRQYFAGLEAIF